MVLFSVSRCVPDNQRAFALGLQFLFLRSLSFIPGPVIFGAVIDSKCILWKKDNCGKRGNCLDYEVDALSLNIFYLGLVTGSKFLMRILYTSINGKLCFDHQIFSHCSWPLFPIETMYLDHTSWLYFFLLSFRLYYMENVEPRKIERIPTFCGSTFFRSDDLIRQLGGTRRGVPTIVKPPKYFRTTVTASKFS